VANKKVGKKPELFPIVEAFGYPVRSRTPPAQLAFESHHCPFTGYTCEKYRQYRFGYCSVTYAAADDKGVPHTYAVCDHRLDGPPLRFVLHDHFEDRAHVVVPEVVLTNPRTSFDYVAFDAENINDVVAVETQAIDIRGGGVGPAWRAWQEGRTDDWRQYFTAEAQAKGRTDNVAYGVNMANIYKRLGLQVAVKGTYLRNIKVPFYVLMQDRPFEYLRKRINFQEVEEGPWDITFITFGYGNPLEIDAHGQYPLSHRKTVRTTVEAYVSAMSQDQGMASAARADFLAKVKSKAGL
jgi:Restriction endonuclease NotI